MTLAVTALAGDIHCPGVTSTGETTSTEILIEVVVAVISIAPF
jgi:hypothetical protein